MTKLVALTLLASVAATSAAHAQAPGETAPLTTPSQPGHEATDDDGPKNPNTALMLSLGGTAASAAMLFAGASMHGGDGDNLVMAGLASSLVTPSLGEWYAGKPLTVGMGIRVASAAAEIAGIAEALKCWDYGDGTCSNNDGLAGFLIIGGLIGYGAGTIYDIADAPREARAYNRTHRWQVTPTVMRTASGTAQMGVGIGGSF